MKHKKIYSWILTLCVISGAAWIVIPREGLGFSFWFGQKATKKPAVLFELPDAQGKLYRLSDLRGNTIVLHFWATWCPPCLEELPEWVEFSKSFQHSSVRWVAVSLDSSWQKAHKIFPEKNKPPGLLSLIDLEGRVPEQYGTFQFPETYLISPDLKIITRWVGPQQWKSAQMRAYFEQLLKSSQN